jgi:DNA-binding transcriptional ArsR family regulator
MDNSPCIRLFADQEQIRNCKNKLKSTQKSFGHLSNILALAGNEVRLNLRKLKDGNLIVSRKEGQTIYYSLTQENLKILKPFFKHINQQTEKLETV